jgi:Ca2+-binding RTX toxin-like protein
MSARNMFESLEGRRLFSGGIVQTGSLITVFGDSSNDVCNVTTDGPTVTVALTHGSHVHTKKVSTSSVSQIAFFGYDGNDRFRNDTAFRSYANGGMGNDLLIGGNSADTLIGGEGTDTLLGRGGNDTLKGDGGGDFLFGGSGNDYLDGGADSVKDFVLGQSGTDTFKERPGDVWDRVAGEPIVV